MNIEDIIDNLLAPISYCYNMREKETFIDVLIDMINRTISVNKYIDTDIFQTALFVYQQLVMFFGDYGVSPKAGWIQDRYKEEVISDLIEWLVEEKKAEELNK